MTETIPYEINDTFAAGWWKPVAKYGDSIYLAYTSPSDVEDYHYVNVAKRDSNGNWTTDRLQSNCGNGLEDAKFQDDWGHNQTTITVDGEGRIHVFTSMHHSFWHSDPQEDGYGHYYRSADPEDIATMVDCSSEMPNPSGTQPTMTYPILCTAADGDVYLVARRKQSSNSPLVLWRWDTVNLEWSTVSRVADNSDPNYFVTIYPDDMIATEDGKLHIAFSWHKNSESPRRHRASYCTYDTNTGAFATADGVTHGVPMGWTVPNLVYQDLTGNEETTDDDPFKGQQTARICVNGNTVNIAYRYRPTNYAPDRVKRARWSAGNWNLEDVYIPNGQDTEATLGIYHDGIVVSVLYIKNYGPHKLYRAYKSTGQTSWTHEKVSDLNIRRISMSDGLIYGAIPGCGKQVLITDVL